MFKPKSLVCAWILGGLFLAAFVMAVICGIAAGLGSTGLRNVGLTVGIGSSLGAAVAATYLAMYHRLTYLFDLARDLRWALIIVGTAALLISRGHLPTTATVQLVMVSGMAALVIWLKILKVFPDFLNKGQKSMAMWTEP